MGLPAKRLSKTRRDTRRSHHGLSSTHAGKCEKCGSPALAHVMCGNCGYYKGRETVNVLAKLDKKEKKKKEKELARQEHEHPAKDTEKEKQES